MTSSHNFNPKVDAYIASAPPFAQPILTHLRELIHKACPTVHETIKWSRPFFEYEGQILGNISAFKAHCRLGFWGLEIGAVLRDANAYADDNPHSLNHITRVEDLPSNKQLLAWLKEAVALIDSGNYTSPIAARGKAVKAPKPSVEIPPEFASALHANQQASATFAAFSPTNQREYSAWIAEAKRPETREKRILQAMEWIAQGKPRHWKYQSSERLP